MAHISTSEEGSGAPGENGRGARSGSSPFPSVTACEMRELDRVLVEEYGITPTTVTVLAGTGGNGGGGLVAARHLRNRGVQVTVTLTRPDLAGVPGQQLRILHRMGVPITMEPTDAELVIDAVIGYSLQGDPVGRAAELVEWANAQPAPVLALDVPSGMDATFGWPGTPCVQARATLTLALPKTGLLHRAEVGELYLGDIGVPTRAGSSGDPAGAATRRADR